MELIVVVIIVGIVASFAIPNFKAMVERNYEKDALSNLAFIAAAEETL